MSNAKPSSSIIRPLALGAAALLIGAGLTSVVTAPAAQAAGGGEIRITEWAYDTSEFSEYTNVGDAAVDLTGWSWSDSPATPGVLDLTPLGTILPGESFVLTDTTPDAFRTTWGLPATVKVLTVPDANKLQRGDELNLFDASDALVDHLAYADNGAAGGPRTNSSSAWIPDGSLGANAASTATLSSSGDAVGSWAAAGLTSFTGSPGYSSFVPAWQHIRLNEVDSDSSPDWVELINIAPVDVDATGFVVEGLKNAGSQALPSGSIVPAGDVLLVELSFGFKKGDTATLLAADTTTIVDEYTWGDDVHAHSDGRMPNGTGPFTALTPTPGTLNAGDGGDGGDGGDDDTPVDPNWADIRINEVTSANADPTHDAYELVNTGDTAVDITGWLQSDSGGVPAALEVNVGDTVPTSIPAHGYVVLLSAAGLSSEGDAVRIYLPDGSTVVDVASWGLEDAQPGSWSRCPDGGSSWVHTAESSWGASNATACAGEIIPTNGGPDSDVPCQTEAASGSGPAMAGGLPWPGSAAWTVADAQCAFVNTKSGQDLSGLDIDPDEPTVMWGAKNKNHLYRLIQSGSLWVADTANDWSTGKELLFPGGVGQPDTEGVTVGPDGYLYVTTERDNAASSVPLDSVLRFDPDATGTSLTATTQWALTTDLADVIGGSGDANLGFEGITWVPDSYLVANGFIDQHTGSAYDPADYPLHGTGLFFLALEKNGHLYAYALNSDASFQRIAAIDTGMPRIADTQWDPDTQRVWAVADNAVAGSSVLMKIGGAGYFVVDKVYDRPTGLPNYNLEGFAITPDSTAVDGLKQVIRADDGNNGGHSLRSGTIATAAGLGLGPQGPAPVAVQLSSGVVGAGSSITITAEHLVPGETYEFTLHSTPVPLGSAVASVYGSVSLTTTIPAGVPLGAHTVTIAAASAPGVTLSSAAVTVSALAITGDQPEGYLLIGGLLTLAGAGLVAMRGLRRRHAA